MYHTTHIYLYIKCSAFKIRNKVKIGLQQLYRQHLITLYIHFLYVKYFSVK